MQLSLLTDKVSSLDDDPTPTRYSKKVKQQSSRLNGIGPIATSMREGSNNPIATITSYIHIL
jgi:hypothetical protein